MNSIEAAYLRLQDMIGITSTIELGVVRASEFQRFAYAVDDLDERYVRPEGGGELQAPPLFLSAVMGWGPGPAEAELRPDGTDPAATAGLPLDGLRIMGAGQDLTFHSPVRDGDQISRVDSVEAVELKDGRAGQLIVLMLRRDYLRSGDLVLTCLETIVAR